MLRQQEHPQTEWQHTPPARPATLSPATEQRFDKNTTQNILETASRLQQAEQDTLSEAEIEALAAEMGIAPRHVRQAIALSGCQTADTTPLTRVRLTGRQKLAALATPVLYGLYVSVLVYATFVASNLPATLIIGSICVLPALLCFWLGGYLRYKRAGAFAGALMFSALVAGVFAGTFFRGATPVHSEQAWLMYLAMLTGAMALGVGGAALRQWLAKRQTPYLPTVTRPSDLDR